MERARAAVRRQRAACREAVPELDPRALRWIDESGSHQAMAREYGRAPRGPRAPGAKPLPRGHHVTRVGALGLGGLVAAMTVAGCVDGAALLALVPEGRGSPRRPGQVVVLDHRKALQVAGVQEEIDAVGARLLSWPPSSPDFSPIAACWAKIKAL
jgi:hypothetical protein